MEEEKESQEVETSEVEKDNHNGEANKKRMITLPRKRTQNKKML